MKLWIMPNVEDFYTEIFTINNQRYGINFIHFIIENFI